MLTFGNDTNEENQNETTSGAAAPNAPEDNGCTYHTGRLYNADNASDEATGSPDGAPDDASADPAPGAWGDAGAYYADRYPYGQNGGRNAPPAGGQYPYGGNRAGGDDGRRRRSAGVIVLTLLLLLSVVVAAIGIFSSVFGGQDEEKPRADGTEATLPGAENVTGADVANAASADGPSISLAQTPAADGSDQAQALAPSDIYNVIKESSVGILLYSDETRELESEGSGVIIGEDDSNTFTYVVTCAHVINAENTSIKVMTFDDATYDAQVVGYDTRTDIGVVRIRKTGLRQAEFGRVESLNVGDYVYAIGNPGGSEFAGSFTNGMISAIARPISSSTGYTTKCIQHTAAINPGNSGGALVNVYGQVIGVNSMKIVKTDYEGMGFAVPSDVVQEIVNDLIANGYIPNRAKLGITYRTAASYDTYSMVVQLREYPKASIVVESISQDSDLVNSDVQAGDLIIAVNGKDLDNTDVLPSEIENASVGDTLTLSIVRVSSSYTVKEFTVDVKLVEDRGSSAAAEEETESSRSMIPETTNNFFFSPFN